ncbi:hypothetical protein VNO77_34261 [Canavalia gladiata]|uniref:Uncharacterized protein n=1 Tax=Canavalia gladiata TaxID=3824 RepID=A0AAN9Q1M1_CANGL
MVDFMESRGVSNSHHRSNRFLANLILSFFIEPCSDFPSSCPHSFSSALLQDAYQHHIVSAKQENIGFQQNLLENALHSCHCHQTKEYSLLQSCNENMAMVGLDSMPKANLPLRTL